MRRVAKFAAAVVAGLVLLVVVLLVGVAGASATSPGRAAIERLVPTVSGGMVRVTHLTGWLFGKSRVGRIEIGDQHGTWLTIEDLTLDWSPLRLFVGEVAIQRLAADRVLVARRPVPSGPVPSSQASSGAGSMSALPLHVDLATFHIGKVELAASVVAPAPAAQTAPAPAGTSPTAGNRAAPVVSLAVDGAARLDALDRGAVRLTAQRLGGQGMYTVNASIDPAGVRATLHLAEPAGGLIGSLATVPAIGAIAADATLAGPLNAIATTVVLTAGQFTAHLTGQVDATGQAADLTVSAEAPAMAPRADLAWHGISLSLHVRGKFAEPGVTATLTADGISAGQAGIDRIAATVQGNAGHLALDGVLAGIRLPGPRPDVLSATPLSVTATMQLAAADRPLIFSLRHALFTVDGTAALAGEQHGEVHIAVPEIAPLAAAGGIDAAGSLALTVRANRHGEDTTIAAQGNVGVTSAPRPLPALLGDTTTLDVLATLGHQPTGDLMVHLSRLTIAGGALSVGASGTLAPGALDLDWRVAIADLAKLDPALTGPFSAIGKVSGAPDNLAVTSDLTGDVGSSGIPPGKVTAQVTLSGLPGAPSGHISAHGVLLGAPLDMALTAARQDGVVHVAIERASWKSAHAEGALSVDPAVLLPQGRLSFAMARLDDATPLLGAMLGGRALHGAIAGTLDSTPSGAALTASATEAGLLGTATVAHAQLDAKVADPLTHPTLDGRLTLDGIAAGGINGSAQVLANGTLDALGLHLSARLPALAGVPATMAVALTVNAPARVVTIASVQADWKTAPIRLLAPVRLSFANGLAVAGLRMGLRQAVLTANGRISPTLNLTARLQGVPANLATLVDPALAMDGTLDADATVTGAPDRPGGTIHVTARGLRASTGPGRALPAADLTATATLQGTSARVDLRGKAGETHMAVTGTVPLAARGPLSLRTTGTVDLAMTDPQLAAGGQRARGRVSLDATVTGTIAAPSVSGQVQLADGSFRDYAHGIDIDAINASLTGDGSTVRLTRFVAKAGPGTLGASGQLQLTAPGMPLDLTLTARNARPLANDLLTASLDADVTVRGNLDGALTAGGRVFVRRAEIRLPDRLPASVPTLDVRVAGAQPLPPPPPGPDIALDLTVDAPQQVFVRGRGLNAEMGGTVRLRGSAANPIPSGGFTLRQGDFSIAGQTVTFSTGQVSFNGGSLTDPSLNFTATTTAGTATATLTIAGTASKPTFTLSSSPSLPQDEVLAELLYGARSASLGPLEIAQIVATLASLSGAAPAVSNPLDSVRAAVGLDRLSIGSGSSLEAGRYVARDVYVGAKQSVTGTGTQAVVQVDLAKGLKLEATAGTSSAPSATGAGGSADAASVGVTYQFEY